MSHVFTNFSYVDVDIGTKATQRPWRENVQRTREALELLALVAFIEEKTAAATDTSTPPVASPVVESRRRYLINCYSRNCIKNERALLAFLCFLFVSSCRKSAFFWI